MMDIMYGTFILLLIMFSAGASVAFLHNGLEMLYWKYRDWRKENENR